MLRWLTSQSSPPLFVSIDGENVETCGKLARLRQGNELQAGIKDCPSRRRRFFHRHGNSAVLS